MQRELCRKSAAAEVRRAANTAGEAIYAFFSFFPPARRGVIKRVQARLDHTHNTKTFCVDKSMLDMKSFCMD